MFDLNLTQAVIALVVIVATIMYPRLVGRGLKIAAIAIGTAISAGLLLMLDTALGGSSE